MATRQQIEQALQNQNVRKMLDVIASSEGVKHGYNTLFGNQRIESLNAHPNIRKRFTQTDGKTNVTTAAGRYQFLYDTWNNVAQRYGLKDFGAQNQDFGAVALIAGRGALNDVINGNWQSAIKKLGPEWASLPSSNYKQNKRSWDFVNKQLGVSSQPQEPQRAPTVNWADLVDQNSNTQGKRAPTSSWADIISGKKPQQKPQIQAPQQSYQRPQLNAKNPYQGLRLKSNEAIAGGKANDHTVEFAHLVQGEFGNNLRHFASFNDTYHKGSNSKHAHGNAFDFSIQGGLRGSQAVKRLQALAQKNGYQIRILDEYAKPSKNATGGHMHVTVVGRSGGQQQAPAQPQRAPTLNWAELTGGQSQQRAPAISWAELTGNSNG